MSNTHAGLCTTGVVALCGAVVYELFAARLVLGWLAGNAEVLKLAADVSLPTALCMLGFSFMMVSIQLLNSCGKNTQGTAVAFCACWVVGITASLVLALVGIEGWVKGKTALLYCPTAKSAGAFCLRKVQAMNCFAKTSSCERLESNG